MLSPSLLPDDVACRPSLGSQSFIISPENCRKSDILDPAPRRLPSADLGADVCERENK